VNVLIFFLCWLFFNLSIYPVLFCLWELRLKNVLF
jgi:hypothetical protein